MELVRSRRTLRPGAVPAVSDVPGSPRVETTRGVVPDRHGERRRHDRAGGREGAAAVQQSRL